MSPNGRKIVIVGGGIAGLCTAVYALQCGYKVELIEMNDMAGGLAMSWRRGRYTFETCLHWLVGSSPKGEFHDAWNDVCEFDKLAIVDLDEFVRIETEAGDALNIYTNVDRLEAELLAHAPQDAVPIRELTHAIRVLGGFKLLDPSAGLAGNWRNMLRDLPLMGLFGKLTKMSGKDYAQNFSDPLIGSFFSNGDIGDLSAVAMVLSLAWMNTGNAGYCIGGSQALIRLIEDRVAALGGRMRFGSRVERILVESGVATGVQLQGGETIPADWVVSAADGHSTLFDLLGGAFLDNATRERYDQKPLFSSYLQVSLGIGLDLHGQPPMIARILDTPFTVDPGTELNSLSFRLFHFDPTFAPAGKTAVTCFLPTRNFEYWSVLREKDPAAYNAEKRRVAKAVIAVFDKRIPGARDAVEVVDVSTPASVIRHTGNWKGSMEGWLVRPGDSFKPLPNTLPGLGRFLMVGQWVLPGGGLPSGPMTARPVVKSICKHDGVRFTPGHKTAVTPDPVAV